MHVVYILLFVLLFSQCLTAVVAGLQRPRKRTQPLTEIQKLVDDDRKKVQQQEMVFTKEQQARIVERANELKQHTNTQLIPSIEYSESLQWRSDFVCSSRAPPPSILDFNSSSVWRRIQWSSSGDWSVFSGIYDIFPLLVENGFRIAFIACSSCETLFGRAAVPRHCSWPDRSALTVLHKDTDFLYSCAIPKGLWSSKDGGVRLTLKASTSKLQLTLDRQYLPISLPCHPPYKLSAATMVWAFREMFKTLQWIEYHRVLGVEHFFIYDNIRDPLRRLQRLLKYHIDSGVVTYVHDPVIPETIGDRHFLANRHAANRFGVSWTEWLWIGDVDEYLISPNCGQSVVDVLHHIEDDVATVVMQGPKFTYDEKKWWQFTEQLKASHSVDSFVLDIELYTQITDYVPHLRQKSITRGTALLDVANHEPLSYRNGFTKVQKLNTSELLFAHLFFHPWGRLPQPEIRRSHYIGLRHCYANSLRERLKFIFKQLQLTNTELYWYLWGHQLDQLAVNFMSEKLFKDSKRRHPGGW